MRTICTHNYIISMCFIVMYTYTGPYAEILKGGFYFNVVGNPRCGGLGVQPPDADKSVIFQHSKYA